MTLIEFAIIAVIAALCGFIGQFVTGYSRGGCPVSIAAGFIGAWLGPWVAAYFGQPELFILPIPDQDVPIIWSAAGGLGLVVLVNLVTRKRKF